MNINEFGSPFPFSIKLVVSASNYALVLCGVFTTSVMIHLQKLGKMERLVPFLLIFALVLMALYLFFLALGFYLFGRYARVLLHFVHERLPVGPVGMGAVGATLGFLFKGFFKVDVRTRCEAVGISPKEKTVDLKDVKSGEVTTVPYDKLGVTSGMLTITRITGTVSIRIYPVVVRLDL